MSEEMKSRSSVALNSARDAKSSGERSGHTPGPWTFDGRIDAHGQPVVRAADYEVATCWHHCVGSIEREAHANARLIAAAPEMFEALKAAYLALRMAVRAAIRDAGFSDEEVAEIDRDHVGLRQIRAALAKALPPQPRDEPIERARSREAKTP